MTVSTLASRPAGCRRARSPHRPGASSACSASLPRVGRAPWPEDRLLSDHIVPTAELDPLARCRRRPPRLRDHLGDDGERDCALPRPAGRGRPATRPQHAVAPGARPTRPTCRANRVPAHAFSETDRLMARPAEFRRLPQARAASDCWFDWLRPEITPHDGAVRPDHPDHPRHPRAHPVGELAPHALAQPLWGSSGATGCAGMRRRAAKIP